MWEPGKVVRTETMAKLKIQPDPEPGSSHGELGETREPFHFPIQISERRLLLVTLDLLAINVGLAVGVGLRPDYASGWQLPLLYPHWFLLLSGIYLVFANAFDSYNLRRAAHMSDAAEAVAKSGFLAILIFMLIPYLTPSLPPSRRYLVLFPVIALTFLLVGRAFYVATLARLFFRRRTLIIGAGWAGSTVLQALRQHGDDTYHIVGFIDDDPVKAEMAVMAGRTTAADTSVEVAPPDAPRVIGNRNDLDELLSTQRVKSLILAINHDIDAELLQCLMGCLERGVEIIPMSDLYEQLTGHVPVEHVQANWYVAMPLQHPGSGTLGPTVKRILDFVFSSLGMLLLGVILPFIALAIYIDSPGPIFYTQPRVGKGGRLFKIYKLRTMIPDAEKGTAVWAQKKDKRVTRVGRILRKLHIDEFPQFLNVFNGDMSVVGPRPERPEFVERLEKEIPFYRVRHAVKPGMAGWGLVRQGYAATKGDQLVKLQYDLYYIKHQSTWLDIVVLTRSVLRAMAFRGR